MDTDLVIVGFGTLGLGLMAVFLLLAVLRLLPAIRQSELIRRITLGCGLSWLFILLALVSYGVVRSSDGRTLAIAGGYLLLAITGIGFLAWGRYAWRIKREPLVGPRCPKCFYDLNGLGEPAACPECGRNLGSARRRLYRPRRRRWATATGTLVLLLAVTIPIWSRVRERGWAGLVPDEVLIRMVIADIGTTGAVKELYERSRPLSSFDPSRTRELMVSFADEYERVGAMSFRTGWSRAYQLYQPAMDEQTRTMVREWVASPSRGKRYVASWMMQVQGVTTAEDRRLLLPPLLNDPDFSIQINAIRALSNDCAWPLDDLLAFSRDQSNPAMLYELGNALGRYTTDERALKRRIEIAADSTNVNSGDTATQLMITALSHAAESGDASMLRKLAAGKVVAPVARSVSGGTSAEVWYKRLYIPLVESALGGPVSAGKGQPGDTESRAIDDATAAWSRAALISLCIPGSSLTPPRPIIAEIIDEKIAAAKDAAEIKRLRALKNAVWPGSAPEAEP